MAKPQPGFYDDGAGRLRYYDGNQWTDEYKEKEPAAAAPSNAPLYSFVSHIDGLNARVYVWPDRIEWAKRRHSNMVAIKQITSIAGKKGLGLNTVIEVRTASGALEFRANHKEAAVAVDLIKRLMVWDGGKGAPVAAVPPSEPAGPDHAATLTSLKGLLDAGVLTQDEYDAKKAEILARM